MSEAKFTKGPWNVWRGPQFVGGGEDICIGAGKEWLANMDHRERRCPQVLDNGHFADECDICTIDSCQITEEQLANARLIAAAPALYEACKDFVRNCPACGGDGEMLSAMPAESQHPMMPCIVCKQARAALTSATPLEGTQID